MCPSMIINPRLIAVMLMTSGLLTSGCLRTSSDAERASSAGSINRPEPLGDLAVITLSGDAGVESDRGVSSPAGDMAGETAGVVVAGAVSAGVTVAGVTVAGMNVAGEAAAGEGAGEVAGVGAGELAGMSAGVMMDARVGPGDTDQLRCASGDLCPTAYLSVSRIPSSLMDAELNHCNLQSARGGSAFGSLLDLLGGTSSEQLTQSSIEDGILVIVNHLGGWDTGLTGNQTGTLQADFYPILNTPLDALSINVMREYRRFIVSRDVIITDGLYATETRGDFRIYTALTPEALLPISLVEAEWSGFLSLDDQGFNVREGVLTGYITEAGLRELFITIREACEESEDPTLCTFESFFGSDDESAVETFLTLLGGYDARVSSGEISACADTSDDCNAIGVCVLFEMVSLSVR